MSKHVVDRWVVAVQLKKQLDQDYCSILSVKTCQFWPTSWFGAWQWLDKMQDIMIRDGHRWILMDSGSQTGWATIRQALYTNSNDVSRVSRISFLVGCLAMCGTCTKKRWVVKGNIIPWTGGIVSPTGLPLNYGSRKFIAISAEVTRKGSSVNPSEKALNNSG